MPIYGLLVVEGPHDIEFVARILKPYSFSRVGMQKDLDEFWNILVPRGFPPDGDLLKRVPVPIFFQSDGHSIAVRSAVGDTRLVQTLEEILAVLDQGQLLGVGLILDADMEVPPMDRFLSIKDQIAASQISLELPEAPGEIQPGNPRSGVYVLPDNASSGTLEDILLECASVVYPSLLQGAETFATMAEADGLTREDLREFRKPAGRNKAVISSISSILKPGKAIQVSIQDNRWLKGPALELERVKTVQVFLSELLELS